MKKIFTKIFVAAIAIVGLSATAQAQTSASVSNADATATLIAPIAISQTTPLDFGSIIKGIGTVTLGHDDTRTFTNSAMEPGNQGAGTSGVFEVTGETGYTYSITLGTGSITDGTTPRTLTLSSNKATGTLATGTDTFIVGAAITLDGTEAAGAYAGTYDVTVAYN